MRQPAWLAAAGIAAALVLPASDSRANGRSPATSSIVFQRDHETNIIAGMTFGLLVSNDGGTTWTWLCEAAVGYGGTYDPVYAYTHTGAMFATTFDGLKVQRSDTNYCGFASVTATTCTSQTHCTFVSSDTTDGSGGYFYAAADPTDSKIYKSTDDGSSFPQVAAPGQNNDWWETIEVAPSDNARVYTVGYRSQNGVPKVFLLFSSTDSGSSFQPMAGGSDLTTINSSIIDIAGIDPNDPNTMYVTVNPQSVMQVQTDAGTTEQATYGLWRTTDGGKTFTQILTVQDTALLAATRIAFVARKNGDIVAGTPLGGALVSHDKGSNWEPLAGAPHINCLSENAAGEVWACTMNYNVKVAGVPITGDDAGIMRSTDLATWTKVIRFQDIVGPQPCPVGTLQQDKCVAVQPDTGVSPWCAVKTMLEITSTEVDCAIAPDGAPVDAPPIASAPGGGCCDGGGAAPSSLALGLAVAMLLWRRRHAQPTR